MLGGDATQVARAMPVLQAMGKTITHVGGQGAGQMAKLVNQVLVVVTMQGVAEALLLAEAGGLDLEQTLAAVGGGAAGSWMLNNRGPQVIRRDWRPGFTVDLQQKDLRLVLELSLIHISTYDWRGKVWPLYVTSANTAREVSCTGLS